MRRALVLLTLLLLAGAAAEHDTWPETGEVRLLLDSAGNGAPLRVEVRPSGTRADVRELNVGLYSFAESRLLTRQVVPRAAPGVFRTTVDLPHAGEWGLSVRYGLGLDMHYAFAETTLDPADAIAVRTTVPARGGLGDAPAYLQTAGFAVYGLVLLVSLALCGGVLRRLRKV